MEAPEDAHSERAGVYVRASSILETPKVMQKDDVYNNADSPRGVVQSSQAHHGIWQRRRHGVRT